MQFQFHPLSGLLVLSSVITFAAAIIAVRRTAPGSRTLAGLLFAMALWAGADAVQSTQTTLEGKIFWFNIMMTGVAFSPTLFLLFSVRFTLHEEWVTRRKLLYLYTIPAVILLLIWTNDYHRLVFSSTGIIEDAGYVLISLERGPLYFINVAYSYLSIFASILIFIHASFRSGPLFRNQYRLILTGSLIPFVVSGYSQYMFAYLKGFDLAPVTFGISGIAFILAIYRTGLMDLIPFARSRLIENMQDGVLVLDSRNRVVDFNPKMLNFLGDQRRLSLGEQAYQLIGDWFENPESILNGSDTQTELRISHDPTRYLDVRVTPLYDQFDKINGRLLVFRDITERKDVEKKLRSANFRLQSQLIEIGTLQSKLREQAIRDPLTNLFNRRYLEETLDRELARASRETYSLCVIMIDIDHFKLVNDTYGHEAGDHVLKSLAELLSQHSRRGDFACRHGGEEFVIVMPNIVSGVALERAKKLRLALNAQVIAYGKDRISVTYSMGIALYPAHGKTRDDILRSADKAMYAAKEAGRDTIRSMDEIESLM